MTRALGGTFVIAAIVALLATPLFGSEAKAPARYVDKEHGFSIALPEGWTRIPIAQADVALMASSPKKRANGMPEASLTIGVTKFAGKIDLASFYEETAASLPKQIQDYKQVDSGKAPVGTDEGRYMIYTFSAAGVAMKGVSVLSVRGVRAVSINCMTTPDLYEGYESTFEEIAGSFKFQAAANPKPGASQYTSPDNAFSIAFPNGWAISEPAGQAIVVQAASPLSDPRDTLRESITVAVVADGSSDLDAAAKEVVSGFPKELKVELIDTVPFKIDGHDARRVAYCITANRPRITNNAYLTRDRAKLYIITCSCDEEDFGGFQPFYDKVVHTLKFHAPAAPAAPAASGKSGGRRR